MNCGKKIPQGISFDEHVKTSCRSEELNCTRCGLNVYALFFQQELSILMKEGHNCIRDLRFENVRLKTGLDQNVTKTNINIRSRLEQIGKFKFPVQLNVEDITV